MKIATLLASILLTSLTFGFDQEHTSFTELLQKHVKPNGVNYKSLKSDKDKLEQYLKDLEKVSVSEINDWSGYQQLSYFINLYNAATLNLVLENYPISSFKDEVGGDNGPWKLPIVKTLGKTYTLDQIEHELIRKNYAEPRIHFALNCASAGCPPLRNEAFISVKLAEQLTEQTKNFLADKKTNNYSNGTLTLSPIFDWFKDDFIKSSGTVQSFVDPFFKEDTSKATIKYSDYGWSLNEA